MQLAWLCECVSHALTSENEHLLLWIPSKRFPLILPGHLLVVFNSQCRCLGETNLQLGVHGEYFFR